MRPQLLIHTRVPVLSQGLHSDVCTLSVVPSCSSGLNDTRSTTERLWLHQLPKPVTLPRLFFLPVCLPFGVHQCPKTPSSWTLLDPPDLRVDRSSQSWS